MAVPRADLKVKKWLKVWWRLRSSFEDEEIFVISESLMHVSPNKAYLYVSGQKVRQEDRMVVLACANLTGTERWPLIVTGWYPHLPKSIQCNGLRVRYFRQRDGQPLISTPFFVWRRIIRDFARNMRLYKPEKKIILLIEENMSEMIKFTMRELGRLCIVPMPGPIELKNVPWLNFSQSIARWLTSSFYLRSCVEVNKKYMKHNHGPQWLNMMRNVMTYDCKNGLIPMTDPLPLPAEDEMVQLLDNLRMLGDFWFFDVKAKDLIETNIACGLWNLSLNLNQILFDSGRLKYQDDNSDDTSVISSDTV